MPADWELSDVRRDDQGPLTVERFLQPDRSTRLLLTLPAGAPAEQVTQLTLQAKSIPSAWLRPWNEQTFSFPIFRIQDAARNEGAIALLPEDDLELRPDQITDLSPLTSAERDRYKLESGHSTLAYRYEGAQPPATFRVTKRSPALTAETWSFFHLKPGALAAHYELMFNVRDASTHELSFALPESTPAEIAIRGLESAVVKETNSSVKEGLRHWRVTLAQRAQGPLNSR